MYGKFSVTLLSLGVVGAVLALVLWSPGTASNDLAYVLLPQAREYLLTATQTTTVPLLTTDTDTPSPPPPTETAAPTLTPTFTATPTSSPAPTATPTSPPAAQATPAPAATLIPTPSLEGQVLALLSTNWPFIAAGCGGLALIVMLFLLLRPRRRKQPTPRPTRRLIPEGPYLEGSTASGAQLRFALKPEGCTIGREPANDLVITADIPGWETVSRRHARLYAQAGRWIVEDLNSMNGIYVNGRRTGRNLLYDGWELRIGGVVLTFHSGAGEVQP